MSESLISLLYEALGSPLGIVVQTDSPERLRQRLYAVRRDANDPMLEDISIVVSPTNPASHLWLVKRKSGET